MNFNQTRRHNTVQQSCSDEHLWLAMWKMKVNRKMAYFQSIFFSNWLEMYELASSLRAASELST